MAYSATRKKRGLEALAVGNVGVLGGSREDAPFSFWLRLGRENPAEEV